MTGQAADQDELRTIIKVLRDQVSHLQEVIRIREEEIRRRQHLLAAALERVPAIEEAPSEQRELPVTTPSGVEGMVTYPQNWRSALGGGGCSEGIGNLPVVLLTREDGS